MQTERRGRAESRSDGRTATQSRKMTTDTSVESAPIVVASAGRRFRLWFPARLGPKRKRTKTVNGVKVTVRTRTLELPPGPNGSRGNPFGHAAWVKEWREAVRDMAIAVVGQMGPIQRAAVSIVVHRRALGTADPDNDLSRCKVIIDGLRDARLLSRDTYGAVSFGSITEQRATPAGPGIEMLVEEV